MDVMVKRLTALRPKIEEIMSLTGSAGLTYGLIHQGEVLLTENFGYRDVEAQLPVDQNTIFQLASLTKAMVAAIIGRLVEEKKMSWDTPVHKILPEWRVEDLTVRNQTTIVDCLAHRTGLQMNNYWLSSNNNIVIPLKDSMKLLNGLIPVLPFRGQYQYNNLGYELAGHVIHKLTGKPWDQMVRSDLLEPLGLHRTGTHENFCGPDNVSKSYGALSNGQPVKIGDAQIGDNTLAGAAGGGRSCLNDMLKLMKVWLKAADHQMTNQVTLTPGSPLNQVNHIMSAQIPIGPSAYHETSYAMGWARTQLPGSLGAIGLNSFWLQGPTGSSDGFPVVGKAGPSRLVVFHRGSHPGVLSSAILLPGSQSGIVVLSNTLSISDSVDFIGQLLLESYLDTPEKNDYVRLTRYTVDKPLAWYPEISSELRKNRSSEFVRDPQQYVGVYYNVVGTFHIDIKYDGQNLVLWFQGLPGEDWQLFPWEGETLTWLPESRDAVVSRGRFAFQSPDYYKIKFGVSNGDKIERLTWIHEGWNLPNGEYFYRVVDRDGAESQIRL